MIQNPHLRLFIVFFTFVGFAFLGAALSWSAPYVSSSDELTYLTGITQVKEGTLPDAYMLQGMDTGPYLYPYIALWGYETFGVDMFKTYYLFFLVLTIGLSAYFAFRMLLVPWIPSLILSVVALMPRFSSGLEIFGAFTFKEAIGRTMALPVFFLGSALLIHRIAHQKPLWPLFSVFGFLVFLHPVSVMLFAFASLIASGAVLLFQQHVSFFETLRRLCVSGVAFVLSGAYFFVEVFTRLLGGVAHEGVRTADYVEAIVVRNAWEFPAGSLQWFPHMFIVSAFFVAAIALFFLSSTLRRVREKYNFKYGRTLILYGAVLALSSLCITVLFPAVNLYAMQQFDAPYIFQQWSRVSKFYYLGIFICTVPIAYVLWHWYRESVHSLKKILLVGVVLGGLASSSFGFEVAQYVFGYEHYTESYIPQFLSHIEDDITPNEYREVCQVLKDLGAGEYPSVVSNDFGLRYYCMADLYVSFEEGFAFQRLTRSDVVSWHTAIQKQKTVLKSGNVHEIAAFAKEIGASFVVLPRNEFYAFLDAGEYPLVYTSKKIIIHVSDER